MGQLERECAVYAAVDHPLVPALLGRWREPGISPYPFFAVTRLTGTTPDQVPPENVPVLAAQLGAPETDSHYYWQHRAEWRAARRGAARHCLLAMLDQG